MIKLMIFWISLCIILLSRACSPANVDYVKAHAEAKWNDLDYEVVAYEGYNFCQIAWGDYGGACVWYAVRRDGIMYTGYLKRWGDELHVHGPTAVNATVINL